MYAARVGTRRGRLAHVAAGGCRHGRSAHNVPLADDDPRALCAACFPRCVVCLCSPGARVGACPHAHGVCDECMGAHLAQAVRRGARAAPCCPCGDGGPIDLRRDVSPRVFGAWTRCALDALSGSAARARTPAPLASVGETFCALAHRRACPHCGRDFADFDGCAALLCECGGAFCGLCLRACDDHAACHAHVLVCPAHPHGGERSYHVPMDDVRRVWRGRARAQAVRMLRRIAERDGVLVAWSVARAVAQRDPSLMRLPCLLTSVRALACDVVRACGRAAGRLLVRRAAPCE